MAFATPILRRLGSRSAFTLIELLVVILVVAILIAVAAPSFLGQTDKAHDSAVKQHLSVAYKAAKASATEREGQFVNASFGTTALASAIRSSEPQLTVTTGNCPGDATGEATDIVVDVVDDGPAVGDVTVGDDLVLCADPDLRVWTLRVVDRGPPSFTLTVIPEGGQPAAPENTSLPTISGEAVEGQTLTASPGAWSPTPSSSSYQWRRCDASGGNCAEIGAAQTYTLVAADIDSTIRVRVTATTSNGAGQADSAPTAVVKARPPDIVFIRNGDVYTMWADGSNQKLLTNASSASAEEEPVLSPDKTRVAFVSRRSGDPDLYLANADGSGTVTSLSLGVAQSPAWSPDGTKLAYQRNFAIYVRTLPSGPSTRLTPDWGSDYHPTWAGTDTIVFHSNNRDGNHELYTVPAGGGTVTRLTSIGGADMLSDASPNGAHVAHYCDVSSYCITPVSGLTTSRSYIPNAAAGGNASVSWGAAGILYEANGNIFRINPDGSGKTLLAAGSHPDWP